MEVVHVAVRWAQVSGDRRIEHIGCQSTTNKGCRQYIKQSRHSDFCTCCAMEQVLKLTQAVCASRQRLSAWIQSLQVSDVERFAAKLSSVDGRGVKQLTLRTSVAARLLFDCADSICLTSRENCNPITLSKAA